MERWSPASASLSRDFSGELSCSRSHWRRKLDLVAGDAVLLGHGDGTFAAPLILPSGAGPSVAVGDINGDGIPDIISSDGSVFIGKGDGTFTYQLTNLGDGIFTSQIDNGIAAYGPLAVADFNGDGKLDVAIGFFTTGSGMSPLENGAAIFFNLSQPSALLSVVSAADFSDGPQSPHSIVSAFGKHVALSTASGTPPLLPSRHVCERAGSDRRCEPGGNLLRVSGTGEFRFAGGAGAWYCHRHHKNYGWTIGTH